MDEDEVQPLVLRQIVVREERRFQSEARSLDIALVEESPQWVLFDEYLSLGRVNDWEAFGRAMVNRGIPFCVEPIGS